MTNVVVPPEHIVAGVAVAIAVGNWSTTTAIVAEEEQPPAVAENEYIPEAAVVAALMVGVRLVVLLNEFGPVHANEDSVVDGVAVRLRLEPTQSGPLLARVIEAPFTVIGIEASDGQPVE